MTRANTEQQKNTPWFAKAGAACSIVPISRFVSQHIFALKGGGYGCLFSLSGMDEETDIHIVSDHGIDYTLQLREVSGDADDHFDSKVFLSPVDKGAKEKLTKLPVFVPAADLENAKREAAAAKAAAAAELKAEDAKAEQYRSQYPGSLHFDYAWDEKKGHELGLQQIWRDDKFTYLRGHFQETPALYETKDGKGSLINFDFSNGLFTVPKQLDNGYLAIGKQKVAFHRTGKEQ